MSIKVSFAVPVYNVSDYIEDCVRSLYEQTLDSIEIVFVDDCTPDDSMDIALRVLEEYPHRKSQVKVIRHQQNQGIAVTKREALLGASGEYVIIVDSDDYVDRRMAELMYGKAIETGAEMVVCDYYWEKGGRQYRRTLVPDGVIGNGDNVRRDMLNKRVPPLHVMKLVSRDIYDREGVVWPRYSYGEDTIFNNVTAYYANRIAHVAEPLYYYRYNSLSISHKKLDESLVLKYYHEFGTNIADGWQFLERMGVGGEYKRGEIINKLMVKNRLLSMVGKRKYRKMWWNTYPEINKVILFGNEYYKPTYREWVWVAAIMLGIYPRYKERLWSRRFLPSREWI